MASKNKNFSDRLQDIVKGKLGWNKTKFSKEVKIHLNSATNYLENGVVPEWDILIRICEKIGTTTDYMLKGVESELPREPEEPFIDFELLTEVITGIERFLRSEDLELDPKPKARLIVILYDRFHSAKERPKKRVIREYLKLAG